MKPFTKTFTGAKTFRAYHDAVAWLRERGYSTGSMCSPRPTAIMKGDFQIAKWKNLTAKERREVDGTIEGEAASRGTFREGPVIVMLKNYTEDAQ